MSLLLVNKKDNVTVDMINKEKEEKEEKKIIEDKQLTSTKVVKKIKERKKSRQKHKHNKIEEEYYYVFLMINLAEKATKHTEIRVAYNPEAYVFNRNQPNTSQNQWVVIYRVGKFNDEKRALEFFSRWENKTRGVSSRIALGLVLSNIYNEKEGLTTTITPFTKEEQLKKLTQSPLTVTTTVSSRNKTIENTFINNDLSSLPHSTTLSSQQQQRSLSSPTIVQSQLTGSNDDNNITISERVMDPSKTLSNGVTISEIYKKYGSFLKNKSNPIKKASSLSLNNTQ